MSFHDKARDEATEAARQMNEYHQQNIVQPLLAELEGVLDVWFEEVGMLPKPSTHFIKEWTDFLEGSSNYSPTQERLDYVMVGWTFEGYDYHAIYVSASLSVSVLVNGYWASANTRLEIGEAVQRAEDQ